MINSEEKAREICAWANWVKDCDMCVRMDYSVYPPKRNANPLCRKEDCLSWKNYLSTPYKQYLSFLLLIRKIAKYLRNPSKEVRTCNAVLT